MPPVRPLHQSQQPADSAPVESLPMDPFVAVAMQRIAKFDPLLIMTFARFPIAGPWAKLERDALVGILVPNVCDVVYGPVERPASANAGIVQNVQTASTPAAPPVAAAPDPAKRFYIAPDSYVMVTDAKSTRGAKFTDVPPATVIWDERTTPERGYNAEASPEWGRTDNIMWDDVGTKPDGALPQGVTMRTATGAE